MYEIIDTAAGARYEVESLGEIRGLMFADAPDEVREAVNSLITAERNGEPYGDLEEYLGIQVNPPAAERRII